MDTVRDQPKSPEAQATSVSHPIPSADHQMTRNQTAVDSMCPATSPTTDGHCQGWDREARAGRSVHIHTHSPQQPFPSIYSFDGAKRAPDADDLPPPTRNQNNNSTTTAAARQRDKRATHREYTAQYMDSLEMPLCYRSATRNPHDSPRQRARRRVAPIVDIDYSNTGGSGQQPASSSSSTTTHRTHHA